MHATSSPPPATGTPAFGSAPDDALARLAAAHDDLRKELEALAHPGAPTPCALALPARSALVEACLKFNIHAALARDLVYPAARGALAGDCALERAEAGLHDVQQSIEAVLGLPSSDPTLSDRIAQLQQSVDRQFANEQVALFAPLAMSGVDLDDLGHRLAEYREELLAELGMGDACH